MAGFQETLRRLSVHDDAYIERVLADEKANRRLSGLDAKTHALVSVAALVATGAAPASYLEAVAAARRAGASSEEVVGCVVAVLPAVGVARAVASAPSIGLALDYDVDDALETPLRPSGDR
jgi:alkylhydroperoxidase/carboxymuconolactone decarboxylase family protein YurZ